MHFAWPQGTYHLHGETEQLHGSCWSVWEALANMGFHLQGCAFSTHFSHLSWFATLSSRSFSQKGKFVIIYCVCMQSWPTSPWCLAFAPRGTWEPKAPSILIRLKRVHFVLLSTLIHWGLSKTRQFENAVENGSKQKHTYHVSVYVQKRCVYSRCPEFNLCMQFLLFPNILVWTVKNVSKQKCGHESINVFSMTMKLCIFEYPLV